jgi:hypothetical protein
VVCLAATILVTTGIRLLQALGLLSGIYIFYLFFAQPFVIQSLAQPKTDPQGGYGHFVGDVIPFGIIMLAFIASIGTVLHIFLAYLSDNPALAAPVAMPRDLPNPNNQLLKNSALMLILHLLHGFPIA